ncbi:MAG: Rne/Rng family ribonuclease [Rhodobacteraceae bacterium]|nr:Rne/Rng family ribonuclease [Paracoccaceae bacterium]
MGHKMLIDATHAEETRVVVVDGNKVEEFDFEAINRRQLAGNIYLAKVTRVEPSLQAAFVDYGGNRHGFLAFNAIHPDYYQIPAADREALLEEERVLAREQDDEERTDSAPKAAKSGRKPRRSSNRRKQASKAESIDSADSVTTREISGMDILDANQDQPADDDTLIAEGFGAGAALAGDAVTAPQADAVAEPAGHDSAEDDQPAAGQRADTDSATGDSAAATDAKPATATDTADDAPEAEGEPYSAADHASENDDRIESVSDGGDPGEEVRVRRKPRPRRYKIQEVIRVRQIMLVQVVKEERGNKGAALTTYLSLAGRYCVLMPNTARGGGISRKITNAADRQKLKAIANDISVPEGAGLIIRTAGANRTKAEIKRDYEYLFRLWEQIRDLTLKSIAPTPIYEEGNLIKRSIRDLYSRDIDEVLVEGEAGYRVAKDFMKMIMPSHAKNVKLYNDPMPLFARYQVESYLAAMFNPTVQLPSGGYIVIGITEALVAIDINSGRATREGSIEETALKTNLEAAEEIARQLRLRDLAGLIVIDFIDMEERRNNAAVEKMLKDKLKSDRARIQVGRISGFGLLEMSRQRLRPGMLEATTQPCPHCHGTGLIRSDDSLGLTILRQIEEEGTRRKSREVLVRAPAGVVNFLFNFKREHIAQIEARYGMAVRLEADPLMVSPDFTLEKFKTATRISPMTTAEVVSFDTSQMPEPPDEPVADAIEDTPDATSPEPGDEQPRKKRRRRSRKPRGKKSAEGQPEAQAQDETEDNPAQAAEQAEQAEQDSDAGTTDTASPESAAPESDEKPKPARKPRSRRKAPAKSQKPDTETPQPDAATATDGAEPTAEASDATPVNAAQPDAIKAVDPAPAPADAPAPAPEPEDAAPVSLAVPDTADAPNVTQAKAPMQPAEPAADPASEPGTDSAARALQAVEPVGTAEPEQQPEQPEPEAKAPPKRRGWWAAK